MRIGIWGDSITHGSCDPEALGWVGRVRKSFYTSYEGVQVYGRGVSGNTTRDLLKRFPVELSSLRPDIVVLAIGVNDSVYRGGHPEETEISLSEFAENMQQLVAVAKECTDRIYIIGIANVVDALLQPFPWSSSGKCYANAVIQLFDAQLRNVASEAGVEYIHTFGILSDADLSDGIHPNAEGYTRLAAHIQSKINLAN